jgi:hypothetical protein
MSIVAFWIELVNPADGGSTFLWNVCDHLRKSTRCLHLEHHCRGLHRRQNLRSEIVGLFYL